MTTDSSGVRLGDLLTGAGLLQASDLREAMLISKQQGLPVGRVLIMSGFLTEAHLQAAVQAQSMLKDGLIDFDTVIKALSMVGTEEVSLDDAFRKLKYKHQSDAITNKLGELLMAAEIVPIDALNSALLQCQSIGLPLGRVLVASGALTEQMLAAALNTQVFLRDKKLTRDQAIASLRSARERQIPIEQYLAETGAMQLPTTETVRLGELFVLAKVVDEPSLMGAVEMGLISEKPVGQVLLESKLVSEELLNSALELQKMVAAGAIKKSEAGMFLMTVQKKGISVKEAVKNAQPVAIPSPAALSVAPEGLPLYQFLQISGIITAKQIEQAIRIGSKDSDIMGKMLNMAGILDPQLIKSAQQCNELIGTGVLTTEQGMIALKNCERNNFALDYAFSELGWDTSPLKAFGEVVIATAPSRPTPPSESFETQTLEAVPALMQSMISTEQHPVIQAAEAQALLAPSPAAVAAAAPESSPFTRQSTEWQPISTVSQSPFSTPAQAPPPAPDLSPPAPPLLPPQQPSPHSSASAAPPFDPFQDQFGSASSPPAAEAPSLFGAFAAPGTADQPQQMFPQPGISIGDNVESSQFTTGGADQASIAHDLAAEAQQWGTPDTWAKTTPQPAWGNPPAEAGKEPSGNWAQLPQPQPQPPQPQPPQPQPQPPQPQPQPPQPPQPSQPQPAQPGQPGSWGDTGPSSAWQSSSGHSGVQWQPAAPPTAPAQPAEQPAATQVDSPPTPSEQNWNFDQPVAPTNWQPITQIQNPAPPAPEAANPWGDPIAPIPEPAPPQQWQGQPQPPMPASPAQPAYQQPSQPNTGWQNQPSSPNQTNQPVGAWQQPVAQPDAWQSTSQQIQQPAPPVQQAPADPWQMSGQAQQVDGWQQSGQAQQETWQVLPQQAGASSAAQMFQEAAASLQDQPQPPQPQKPDHHSGPLDLFPDSDPQDEQDKPKKRLSDLMPKLGPKP